MSLRHLLVWGETAVPLVLRLLNHYVIMFLYMENQVLYRQ